ncbi:MAG: methyltransferase domain-containing protein [Spirochaetia bacterium]|nr:methyltransferase domain-containing protein [Spirochaetia bacterium]
MGYAEFSRFYDSAMKDYSWCSSFIISLFNKYCIKKNALLELGCGTGRILELLGDEFNELHGLDISQEMLAYAEKRVPGAFLYHMDMTSFTLDSSFDAILTVFDTINHILDYSGWLETFKHVKRHLNPDGVFFFDINTPARLQRLSILPPFLTPLENDSQVLMEVEEVLADDFNFNVQIFEALGDNLYKRHEISIHEHTVDPFLILKDLKKLFTTVTVYNEECEPAVSKEEIKMSLNGRMFFLCTA